MVSIPNKDDSSRGKVATLMQKIDDQRERECWTAPIDTFNLQHIPYGKTRATAPDLAQFSRPAGWHHICIAPDVAMKNKRDRTVSYVIR
jgi:hypothetical protein